MTDNARIWFGYFLRCFRDGTLQAFLHRCRAGRLDSVLNPLLDLTSGADGLAGTEWVLHATNCGIQADALYHEAHNGRMTALEWLMEFDLARVNGTEAAFVQAIAEVVEMELGRRAVVGRN